MRYENQADKPSQTPVDQDGTSLNGVGLVSVDMKSAETRICDLANELSTRPCSGELAQIPAMMSDYWLPALQIVRSLTSQNDELAQKVRKLEYLCDHDADLMILNRRGLTRDLEAEIARVSRHGVISSFIYLDIDQFKQINDRYGHAAGDQVLKSLAGHILPRLRKTDSLARLGGDEFGIILSHASVEQSQRKIEDLSHSIAKNCGNWGLEARNIGFSAGVTSIQDTDKPDEILKRADANMYEDKHQKQRDPHLINNLIS